VGKPEGKRPLGRPKRSCVENVKMELTDIGWGGIGRIDLALVKTVMNLLVPYNTGKFLSSCTIGGFSRWFQLHEVR
jgi:hypothetical protein